ncbi:Protein of unknown function [Algoriphagus alkaliphilus]|uniref:AAA ATPase domain-containing protein n=1 Tax=Algoriphagus alkaliphilus TaxID=279824 RepID=A0A1G5ZN91_9BACT|nr:DUF3696 domain-containing protein [Algoriphagus alkaliphilus]SDA95996.1 Protein of unknown function [Algoriphagus alkaliphilus]
MRVLTHISLKNFRLFKEKTSFDLAPITILTGTNSSGKSSLIKAILLLKSNFEKNKSIEEIDFSIGDHNLNDFKNSLNYNSESDTICFSFSCYVNDMGVHVVELIYKLDRNNKSKGRLDSFALFASDGNSILKASKQFDDFLGPLINYKFDLNYFINNLKYDSFNFLYDDLEVNSNEPLYDFDKGSIEYEIYVDELNRFKEDGIDSETGWTEYESKHFNQTIESGVSTLGDEFFYRLERKFEENKIIVKRSKLGVFFHEQFSRVILASTIRNIINNFNSISSFDSIRSESKKYYIRSTDNIASFLFDYKRYSVNFNSEVKGFVKSQLALFSLGEEIIIDNDDDEVIFKVFLNQNGRKILLSDLGFGYTQLLPVIMKIALAGHLNLADEDEIRAGAYEGEQPYYSNFFVLQEPEGNLHPSFQTKIADLIVEANKKFNIRFVIETHSEYLIRKLQYLTATKKLSVDDTSILYFHQIGSSDYLQSPYRSIRILENGRLTLPFGEGFFDEADRIAFELYRLKLNDN